MNIHVTTSWNYKKTRRLTDPLKSVYNIIFAFGEQHFIIKTIWIRRRVCSSSNLPYFLFEVISFSAKAVMYCHWLSGDFRRVFLTIFTHSKPWLIVVRRDISYTIGSLCTFRFVHMASLHTLEVNYLFYYP